MPAWSKITIPKKTLKKLYLLERLSIDQIAQKLAVSTGPVQRQLREYGIPIRTVSESKEKFPLSKKELNNLYWKQGLSTDALAKLFGCNHVTILNRMNKLGVPRRTNLGHTKPLKLSKATLEHLYYHRGLSLKKIAKVIHRSEGGVERKFNQYGLKSRGIANRACKYKKKDFSGNLTEKAYLVGFRLGDLNVYGLKNIIQVRCSTTIHEQMTLIRQLFSPYTTVRVTKSRRGDWDVAVLLNKSFNFLIPKHKRVPEWILTNPKAFFAFFAGYTDAEGCLSFKKPGRLGKIEIASFQIQTQQKEIVLGLWANMQKFGVLAPIPRVSRPAGYLDKRGRKNNKDMWRFEVVRKESLWKLIHFLKPYLKHKKKIKMLKLTKRNIEWRNSAPYSKPIALTSLVDFQ